MDNKVFLHLKCRLKENTQCLSSVSFLCVRRKGKFLFEFHKFPFEFHKLPFEFHKSPFEFYNINGRVDKVFLHLKRRLKRGHRMGTRRRLTCDQRLHVLELGELSLRTKELGLLFRVQQLLRLVLLQHALLRSARVLLPSQQSSQVLQLLLLLLHLALPVLLLGLPDLLLGRVLGLLLAQLAHSTFQALSDTVVGDKL